MALRARLVASLVGDWTARPETVANNVLQRLQAELGTTKPDDAVFTLWQAVFDAAQIGPSPKLANFKPAGHGFDRLVRLTQIVKSLSPALTANNDLKTKLSPTWLSGLGQEARSRFNLAPTTTTGTVPSLVTTEWTNLNYFLALLWNGPSCNEITRKELHRPIQPEFDFALYAIWSLRDALETVPPRETPPALLHGAAAWINVACRRMWESKTQWQPSDKTGAPAKIGKHFIDFPLQMPEPAEANGFSQLRMMGWHILLSKFDHKDTDEITRDVVNSTSEAMGRVQAGQVW